MSKERPSVRKKLREATGRFFKLLLTATPLQNSMMELYGLVSVIDEHFFGYEKSFRAYLNGSTSINSLVFLRKLPEPICKRTLRRLVQQAGLIKYTEQVPARSSLKPRTMVSSSKGKTNCRQRKNT